MVRSAGGHEGREHERSLIVLAAFYKRPDVQGPRAQTLSRIMSVLGQVAGDPFGRAAAEAASDILAAHGGKGAVAELVALSERRCLAPSIEDIVHRLIRGSAFAVCGACPSTDQPAKRQRLQ